MKQAEKIVLEEFPKKVLEFNNLLEVGLFLVYLLFFFKLGLNSHDKKSAEFEVVFYRDINCSLINLHSC